MPITASTWVAAGLLCHNDMATGMDKKAKGQNKNMLLHMVRAERNSLTQLVITYENLTTL